MTDDAKKPDRVKRRRLTGRTRPVKTGAAKKPEKPKGPTSNTRRFVTSGEEWMLLPGQKNYIRVRDGKKRPPKKLEDKQPVEQESSARDGNRVEEKSHLQELPIPPRHIQRRDLLTLWYEMYYIARMSGAIEDAAKDYATAVVDGREGTSAARLRAFLEKANYGPYVREPAGTPEGGRFAKVGVEVGTQSTDADTLAPPEINSEDFEEWWTNLQEEFNAVPNALNTQPDRPSLGEIEEFLLRAEESMAEDFEAFMAEHELSQNGPNNTVEVPHTVSDEKSDVRFESGLDYDRELKADDLRNSGFHGEEDVEGIMAYWDALHAPDLTETEQGHELSGHVAWGVATAEVNLVGSDVEYGYGVGTDGDWVFVYKGTDSQVAVPRDEKPGLRNGYYTHAHPGDRPLSPDDLIFAVNFDVREARAVSPTATYRLIRPEGGWPYLPNVGTQFNREIGYAKSAVFHMGGGRVDYQTTAVEDVKVQHTVMMRLADKFGLTYIRTPHNA